jgi:hypothetical protein
VQRAEEQVDGQVDSRLRERVGGLSLFRIPVSESWEFSVALETTLVLPVELARTAEVGTNGKLVRAIDASTDDGGSFMVGSIEKSFCGEVHDREISFVEPRNRGWFPRSMTIFQPPNNHPRDTIDVQGRIINNF